MVCKASPHFLAASEMPALHRLYSLCEFIIVKQLRPPAKSNENWKPAIRPIIRYIEFGLVFHRLTSFNSAFISVVHPQLQFADSSSPSHLCVFSLVHFCYSSSIFQYAYERKKLNMIAKLRKVHQNFLNNRYNSEQKTFRFSMGKKFLRTMQKTIMNGNWSTLKF